MTDDDRLAELFRAAASDVGAPPPSFGHDDVLAASRRITARRRRALIGAGFAVFALVGVGAVVALPGGAPTPSTVAAAPAPPPAAAERPMAGRAAAAPEGAAADAAAPATPSFGGAPLGPGNTQCADRQDPRLRAYLEQVLPEVIGAPPAASTEECRPGGERYVTVEVDDQGVRGLFGVAYLPPGTAVDPAIGGVSRATASGGTVIVHSGPAGGTMPGPFADRLVEVADFLAPRL